MAIEITPAGTHGSRVPTGRTLRVMVAASVALRRRFRGSGMFGPMSVLNTVGAKSGQPRAVALDAFPDGPDRWLVVGLGGGSAKHPAWFVNLARNPDQVSIEVGDRTVNVTPELLLGPERAEAWQQIIGVSPKFAGYDQKTDRQLPVVRLTAAS